MVAHDPLSIAFEIREQLASEKRRLAFFIGAGTSMAVGFPGIQQLTDMVSAQLEEPYKTKFNTIRAEISAQANVEAVLDRIRTYCELIGKDEEKVYSCLKGCEATGLDAAVCKVICDIFCADPPEGLSPHLIFAQWIGALRYNRDWPVEIFTTNYDLLIERAMETHGIPYFDGFGGSVKPFFLPESVEAEKTKKYDSIYPPRGWTRLWKIHGSINWSLVKDENSQKERIARLTTGKGVAGEGGVIFPSREKYIESRKLPYIAFQDRLRRLLIGGECLLIIIGYSFSDEHLNEIIFQGLRSNPHLAVLALMYGDSISTMSGNRRVVPDEILRLGKEFRNLSIYGPDKACIGGISGQWDVSDDKKTESEYLSFWNKESKTFTLGSFKEFAEYLEKVIGFQSVKSQNEEVVNSSKGDQKIEDSGGNIED
ncbi:MAG: SIR2 family protein [Dehalococcoides mccartyi]|uniref:SIR2 family NAD-dependent protein deacylase n=1 Tax=Dehalococcoides TaxID=61434 RepID=UPI002737F15F|nr:SIR2 family protein [Dehalococcoides mccartyi]MDP4280180.1 SIR2 family protein [Dehalococcoides mccartyi]